MVSGDIEMTGLSDDHGHALAPFRSLREIPQFQRVPPHWQTKLQPLIEMMDKFRCGVPQLFYMAPLLYMHQLETPPCFSSFKED